MVNEEVLQQRGWSQRNIGMAKLYFGEATEAEAQKHFGLTPSEIEQILQGSERDTRERERVQARYEALENKFKALEGRIIEAVTGDAANKKQPESPQIGEYIVAAPCWTDRLPPKRRFRLPISIGRL